MNKLNEEFYEKLKEKIQPYFEGAGSHAFDPTQRVYNLCLHIAKSESVDLDILKAAALLHDIARKKENECQGSICHAEEGAKMAKDVLKERGFPDDKIKKVCYAISVHRYNKGLKAETKEAQILQDADRLDALGAITIARIFDYGGKKNRPLHDPKLNPREYAHGSESNSSFIHFYEKILKIKPETFCTEEARNLAKDRYAFTESFVNRFIKEWNGEL